ncbi:MAG TPA: HWE histidine kinase domain-containing protein [Caulobacteraceae bacterium]
MQSDGPFGSDRRAASDGGSASSGRDAAMRFDERSRAADGHQSGDRGLALEDRLRAAFDAGRIGVFEWPVHEAATPPTDELLARLGLPKGLKSTAGPDDHPEDVELLNAIRQRALSGAERFIDFEFRYFEPSGQTRWLQVRSELCTSAAGKDERLVGIVFDVTGHKKREDQLRLLAREANHRTLNIFSVIHNLVTAANGAASDNFRNALLGRIEALARAHWALAAERWKGAELRTLMERAIGPYRGNKAERIELRGPPCQFPASEAEAITLVIHELATNAAKYGSLSGERGVVSVEWEADHGRVRIAWTESGGPRVRRPQSEGFGTQFIERIVEGGLAGTVKFDWRATGLRCDLTFPIPRGWKTLP